MATKILKQKANTNDESNDLPIAGTVGNLTHVRQAVTEERNGNN